MELKHTSARLWAAFFFSLLAYTQLMLVPVSFQATMPYLDSSWGYDLNYFLHSRFRFGPDLIFTYGPLGFLNNPQHVGHHIEIAVLVHGLFWLLLGVQLTLVWRSGNEAVAIMFCIGLLLGHRLYYDYWDFYLLALCLITIVKMFRTSATYFDLCLLPVLFGVTFLLKFSAFFAAGLMLAAYTLHLIVSARPLSKRRSAWLIICYLSGPAAYLIYSPSLPNLILYMNGAAQIAGGFATAMSLESDAETLKRACLVALLLSLTMGVLMWQRRLRWTESLMAAMITWNSFRQGFVRADSSHTALFSGFSILVCCCLFVGFRQRDLRITDGILVLSAGVIIAICLIGMSARYPVLVASNWWPQQAVADFKMLSQRQTLLKSLDHSFDQAFAALPGMALRASIEGSRVAIFPFGTPYVAKLNFDMFPNYTLQDYAAYTSYLDRRAARNLQYSKPPVDKVLFEWASIDDRNLMLDTPATTLALLSAFQLENTAPGVLLLRRRAKSLSLHWAEIDQHRFLANEWVQIPYRNQLVGVSIDLRGTLMGQLITGLYRQEPVYIELETNTGSVRRYRVPPQTLSTPGPITYVPQTLEEFEKLWSTEPLSGRTVRVRLLGPGLQWSVSSGYRFYEIQNAGVTLAN